MKLEGFTQTSPATEGGCRRQNPDGIRLESELKKGKAFRRKRREFQRTKSLSEGVPMATSSSPEHEDDDVSCPKKKVKSEVEAQLEESIPTKAAEKNETIKAKGGDEVTCVSHGSISVIGRRREMEDYVTVKQGFLNNNNNDITTGGKKYDFFGVYDGHGGWRVARACGERLHELVAEVVAEHGGGGASPVAWEKVMVDGFLRMDEEVNKKGGKTVEMTGSTAVVAVVGSEEVVVANCGDSRAVMGRRGGEVVQLSDDHKPERPDELERIEVSGGKVINWNGQRVLGVLAISRSIGDRYLKPFVMTEPEVKVMKRSEDDEFLILASDGLWDVVSNDLACQVVRRCLDKAARRSHPFCCNNNDSRSNNNIIMECGTSGDAAAAVLAELAMARGSRDNISVIVVELKSLG